MGGFNGIRVALYFIHGNSLHLLRVCYVLDIVLNTFYGLSHLTCPMVLGVGTIIISILQMRELWLREVTCWCLNS